MAHLLNPSYSEWLDNQIEVLGRIHTDGNILGSSNYATNNTINSSNGGSSTNANNTVYSGEGGVMGSNTSSVKRRGLSLVA